MLSDPRALAFLEGPLDLGEGMTLRPLSLGSILLAEHFDLSVVLSGGDASGLTKEELNAQLGVYLWMQSAPIPEVLQAAREGTWEKFKNTNLSDELTLQAVLVLELRRHRDALAASRYRTLGKGSDGGPFQPCWHARIVHLLTYQRGWSEAFVLWHLPYVRAMHYEHCMMRSLGWRTDKGLASGSGTPAAQQLEALEKAAQALPSEDTW